ncbi:MAG: NAD(P) transhydrogenase subunit alpha [Actinomycetota bacterium]|jgi:NAD(P) transhydrogenase subunit alpha|nr:NAD(P) transhydrogenase subunit alpha [Actinomycetota bacterium]
MTQALLLAAVESGEPSRLVTNLALLVVAGFVGYAVISKVPNTLHTPLMSGTNAIHGVVILGGLVLLAGSADLGVGTSIILFVALLFGAINVVGGFVVTDRMLEMFKAKPAPPRDDDAGKEGGS